MQVNSVSSSPKLNFNGGLHVLSGAKKSISENMSDFYLGNKNVESIYAKLEGTKIDLLKYPGIKSTPETKILNDIDVNLHNVYVNPANGEKTYLYSIPQIGNGYYTINSKKSVLENPVSLYKDIVTRLHKSEIANKFNLIKELYVK